MPNQIKATGTLANPPNPLFLFNPDGIRQHDGLLCLNDLHKASGNDPKHKPANFIRKDTTQGLIKALESQTPKMRSENQFSYTRSETTLNADNTELRSEVYFSINGGVDKGSYGCRELVYAYAMWIDPYFYAMVLKVFDRVATGTTSYTAKLNALCRDLIDITELLTFCGRNLSIQGKHTKPAIQKEISDIMASVQPQLSFTGE